MSLHWLSKAGCPFAAATPPITDKVRLFIERLSTPPVPTTTLYFVNVRHGWKEQGSRTLSGIEPLIVVSLPRSVLPTHLGKTVCLKAILSMRGVAGLP